MTKNKSRGIIIFMFVLLLISFLAFMKQDILRLLDIEQKEEIIQEQKFDIVQLISQLDTLEYRILENEKENKNLLTEVKRLKKIIHNEKGFNNILILDDMSVDTSARGEVIKISR